MIDLKAIDKTWTLFLDRDGVINHEKYLDYIHTWEEFKFLRKDLYGNFSAIIKFKFLPGMNIVEVFFVINYPITV